MKTEAGFYLQLKMAAKKHRQWNLTRIENWAGQGIPDLLICDESGAFHFIELKFCKANAVKLSPHQISWLIRHAESSSWILITRQRKAEENAELSIYKASQALEVAENGLKTKPVQRWKIFDWPSLFQLISPI